jgi:metal-responsive CopG/Arc/MetJ family transcriptional regulator
MLSRSQQQRVSIEIDAALLEQLDQWSGDRTKAIEEAIQLWCQHKASDQMKRAANLRRQIQDSDETGWLV